MQETRNTVVDNNKEAGEWNELTHAKTRVFSQQKRKKNIKGLVVAFL